MNMRSYAQVARAASTEETRRRILEAAIDELGERPFEEVPLAELAARAGTSPQTILRHFGSKDRLFAAALETAGERVERQRNEAPIGDVAGAVENLADHYEEWGDRVLRLLAREESVREITTAGRRLHERWVERTFAPQLKGLRGGERRKAILALVVACDVLVWKILCRDRTQSRKSYVAVVETLIRGVIGGG